MPTFDHVVSDDGLSLTSRAFFEDGSVMQSIVGWKDARTAQDNYHIAVESFETNWERLKSTRAVGDRRRLKKFQTRVGTFWLHCNTGPPTWWKPRFVLKKDEVMVGWLRGLVAAKVDWSDTTTKEQAHD